MSHRYGKLFQLLHGDRRALPARARQRECSLLSSLDWALIETWKEANIPLEAVLRGIDRGFEKYHKRKRATRKVNSLAYCAQEVLAAATGSTGAPAMARPKEASGSAARGTPELTAHF